MPTLRCLVLTGASLVASLAGCGDDARPPPGVAGKASEGKGGGAGTAGSGGRASGGRSGAGGKGAPEAGAAGDAGAGGADGSTGGDAAAGRGDAGGGQAGEAGGGARAGSAGSSGSGPVFDCPDPEQELPAELESVCDPEPRFGDPESVPIPSGALDTLASITPDELSIAWGVDEGFSGAYYVADRESADSDFEMPKRLDDAEFGSAQKVALSPDGLRLALAVEGRFLISTRAGRGEDFGTPLPGEFEDIDADAEARGVSLADVVFGQDDRSLYYSLKGDSVSTLHVSTRSDVEAWPLGTPLADCELELHENGVRQPTGISADGLTLFYFDAARGLSRAAFRASVATPFVRFVDLPGYGAQPNAACDRLYYSAPTDAQLGVVFAERD